MRSTCIMLAAGKGRRVGGDVAKQYLNIAGRPIIAYTLENYEKSIVDDILLVISPEDDADAVKDIISRYSFKKTHITSCGGSERYLSVYNALESLKSASQRPDYVLIQDGARPYTSPEGIKKVLEAASRYGGAIAAAKAKDTIKISDENGLISSSTCRQLTWQAQTPQCFRYDDITKAYEKLADCMRKSAGEDMSLITDDAFVFKRAFPDRPVKLVDLGQTNFKITTPEDVSYMRWIEENR